MRMGSVRYSMCGLAVVGSLFLPGVVLAQGSASGASGGSLLVLSKRDHTLAVIDGSTLKVVGKAPVGDDPHEVIASSDGKTAYVSNYGSGALHTLAVIDLEHGKALPSIDLGALRGPHGLTFVGGKTWFTAEGAKAIGRYDPATKKIDWIMGTGQNRTHMIYVSPDMKMILTTNVSSGTVSIFEEEAVRMGPPPGGAPGGKGPGGPPDGPGSGRQAGPGPGGRPRMDWNETVVRVGDGSEGFDVSPDGKEMWVANAQDGTISVIDLGIKRVVGTLAAGVKGANRLKFTLDGRYALVSMLGSGDLVVMDVASHRETKRIPIGTGAAGILMEPGGARAFVACTPDDSVAVIDLKTLEVAGKIDAGGGPDGMAWAARP